jgi:hypothetical protein
VKRWSRLKKNNFGRKKVEANSGKSLALLESYGTLKFTSSEAPSDLHNKLSRPPFLTFHSFPTTSTCTSRRSFQILQWLLPPLQQLSRSSKLISTYSLRSASNLARSTPSSWLKTLVSMFLLLECAGSASRIRLSVLKLKLVRPKFTSSEALLDLH